MNLVKKIVFSLVIYLMAIVGVDAEEKVTLYLFHN